MSRLPADRITCLAYTVHHPVRCQDTRLEMNTRPSDLDRANIVRDGTQVLIGGEAKDEMLAGLETN